MTFYNLITKFLSMNTVDNRCHATIPEGYTQERTLNCSCSTTVPQSSDSIKISHQSQLPSYQRLLSCPVRRAGASRIVSGAMCPYKLSGQKLLLRRDGSEGRKGA